MSVKEFDKKFGLTSTIEDEKERFVNRIQNSVFDNLVSSVPFQDYVVIFEKVCYELGLDALKIIKDNQVPLRQSVPNLRVLCIGDFVQTLRVVVALYHAFSTGSNKQQVISDLVTAAIDKTSVSIGVRWNDGVFYPTGETLLDKKLIDESLQVLHHFPNESKDLKIALDHYQSKRLDGVVENCYLAIEGLLRKILGNGQTLLNNKTHLLKLLSFSKYWGNMIAGYIDYANEYRRHAGEKRHEQNPAEVEAFLYLTCLFIRAIVKVHEETKK